MFILWISNIWVIIVITELITKYQALGGNGGIMLPAYTGPGPTELIGGYTDGIDSTKQHGLFGEVLSADFIDGEALASAIGLEAGVPDNTDTSWLKFYKNGRIVFVPANVLRHNLTWEDIYRAGAVYGNDGYGAYPRKQATLQDARVTIGEDTYKVMLLKGTNSDPSPTAVGYDSPASYGSEWDRLLYNVAGTVYDTVDATPADNIPPLGLIDIEQELASENGRYSWCQERSFYKPNHRVIRGNAYIFRFPRTGMIPYYANASWLPCLELVN